MGHKIGRTEPKCAEEARSFGDGFAVRRALGLHHQSDEDYIPLVRAVQFEGARVHIWFVSNGLSPKLRHVADHFVDLDEFLLPK
jgi:hypothetical protein